MSEFLLIASTLKSKSFTEEEEWRLVTKPLDNHPSIRFREGASTIIPYRPINISDTKNFPIKQIIIGPTPNKQLSKKAVDSLLSCKGIKSCDVKTSNISYRIS